MVNMIHISFIWSCFKHYMQHARQLILDITHTCDGLPYTIGEQLRTAADTRHITTGTVLAQGTGHVDTTRFTYHFSD